MPEPIIDLVEIDTIPEVQGSWRVGSSGVTRIDKTTKPGMYGDIPYVQVFAGDDLIAEHCQHNIVGVYFRRPTVTDPARG